VNIHLKALGCRLNEAELESWAIEFQTAGHTLVNEAQDADITVVNTCAVTREAVRKSRKLINRLRRESPYGKLVVSGCAVSTGETVDAKDLGIDLLIDNSKKSQLVKTVTDTLPITIMPEGATLPAESALFKRNRQRAFIKIQDGCRYRCSYCIVTVARGDEKSRSIAEIVEEINLLETQGIKEAVLTGVHVGGYGSDIKSNLTELVEEILKSTDIPRLRFASVEPWDLGDNFFTLFDNKRLMPHMHLPLQSGSNTILRRMARRCRTSEFTSLVQQARSAVPNFNVTTDIIVGFPGETEELWAETIDFVETLDFGHMHIFSYSKRQGTKAHDLPDQVPDNVKKTRSSMLKKIADQQKHDFIKNQLGTEANVLWERETSLTSGNARTFGYTENYTRVCTESQTSGAGTIGKCQLTSIDPQGQFAHASYI